MKLWRFLIIPVSIQVLAGCTTPVTAGEPAERACAEPVVLAVKVTKATIARGDAMRPRRRCGNARAALVTIPPRDD